MKDTMDQLNVSTVMVLDGTASSLGIVQTAQIMLVTIILTAMVRDDIQQT